MSPLRRWFGPLGLGLVLAIQPLAAQQFDEPLRLAVTVASEFTVAGLSTAYDSEDFAAFSYELDEASDGQYVFTNGNHAGPTLTTNLQVNRPVTLTIDTSVFSMNFGAGVTDVRFWFQPPAGYRLRVLDGPSELLDQPLRYLDEEVDGFPTIQVVLEKVSELAEKPGLVRPSRVGRFLWSVSLGQAAGGFGAGSIRVAEPNLGELTAAHLQVVDAGDHLNVIRDGFFNLEQVRFPGGLVVVDMPTGLDEGEGFDLLWYSVSDVTGFSSGSYTLGGSAEPYLVHEIRYSEDGGEIEVELVETRFGASNPDRVWKLTLTSGGSTKLGRGWTSGGAESLIERSPKYDLLSGDTAPQFGGDSVHLDEVKAGSTLISRTWREFKTFGTGQELIAEIRDPDLPDVSNAQPVATLYTYHEAAPIYRLPKTIRYPNGNWIAYDYYQTGALAGMLRATAEPWKDSPSTPPSTFSDTWSDGKLTLYTYETGSIPQPVEPDPPDNIPEADPVGPQRRPRLSTTVVKVLGSIVSETQTTYLRGNLQGRPTVVATMRVKPGPGLDWANIAAQVTESIDREMPSEEVDGLGGRVVRLDETPGRRVVSAIRVGRWSEDGDDRELNETIHTLDEPDTLTVSWGGQRADGGYAFDDDVVHYGPEDPLVFKNGSTELWTEEAVTDLYLFPHRSTATLQVRSIRGVILQETYVYTGSGIFQRLGWDRTTWGGHGPIAQTNHQGLTLGWDYNDDGTVDEQTRADGSVVEFTYDQRGRVIETLESGYPAITEFDGYEDASTQFAAIASRRTTFGYDAANRLLWQRLGEATGEYLTTTFSYDRAGRQVLATQPCGQTIETSWSSSLSGAPSGLSWLNVVTQEQIGGAGLVTVQTSFRDGSINQMEGTGVQPGRLDTQLVSPDSGWAQIEQQTYLVEAVTSSPDEHLVATRRFNGLGQVVLEASPSAKVGGGWISTSYEYDLRYMLTSRSLEAPITTSSDPVRTHYHWTDALGTITQVDLDLDEQEESDPDGPDRTVRTEQSYVYHDSAWWLRQQTIAYPEESSGGGLTNSFVLGRAETRLTGFAGTLVGEVVQFESQQVEADATISTVIGRTRSYVDPSNGLARTLSESNQATAGTLSAGRRGQAEYQRSPNWVIARTYFDFLGRVAQRKSWYEPENGPVPSTTYTYTSNSTQLVGQVQVVGMSSGSPIEAVTTYSYSDCTQLASISTVAPGPSGSLTKVTRFGYDDRGRQTEVWGSAVAPLWRRYDGWGRLAEQRTFRETPTEGWNHTSWPYAEPFSQGQATLWERDERTGLVLEEVDDSGSATVFTYDGLNRELTRTWARDDIAQDEEEASGRFRRSEYHPVTGELAALRYRLPDEEEELVDEDTADIEFTYDKLGRLTSVTDGLGTRQFVHDHTTGGRGSLLREELDEEYYLGRHLGHTYNTQGRWSGYTIGTSGDSDVEGAVSYNWSASSGLLSTIQAKLDPVSAGGGTQRTWNMGYGEASYGRPVQISTPLTSGSYFIDREYDFYRPGQVRGIYNAYTNQGNIHASYTYSWDGHGRLSEAVQNGSMFTGLYGSSGLKVSYDYDLQDRLTSTGTEWHDGTSWEPLSDRSMSIAYDPAGNRTQVTRYAGTHGSVDPDEDYTVNDLNQVTGFTNIPRALFTGAGATTGYSLKLLSESNLSDVNRAYDYFFDSRGKTVTADGWVTGYIRENGSTIDTALVPIRPPAESRTFDADGNPTQSGSTEFEYDAENRLIKQTTPNFEMEVTYDYLGRRARTRIRWGTSSPWAEFEFAYVNGLPVGILRTDEGAQDEDQWERQLFTWGLDRSGSLGGAGGIGGLLEMVQDGPDADRIEYLVATDGLGNVTAYLDRATGERVAEFEYNPFGESVRVAEIENTPEPWRFPFRYQTKLSSIYFHSIYVPVHEIYDFGQRAYEPTLGRFLTRDPIGVAGGANLYGYLGGGAFGRWDAWGWNTQEQDGGGPVYDLPPFYVSGEYTEEELAIREFVDNIRSQSSLSLIQVDLALYGKIDWDAEYILIDTWFSKYCDELKDAVEDYLASKGVGSDVSFVSGDGINDRTFNQQLDRLFGHLTTLWENGGNIGKSLVAGLFYPGYTTSVEFIRRSDEQIQKNTGGATGGMLRGAGAIIPTPAEISGGGNGIQRTVRLPVDLGSHYVPFSPETPRHPATVIGHELGHAVGGVNSEARNVQWIEDPVRLALGDRPRGTYSGVPLDKRLQQEIDGTAAGGNPPSHYQAGFANAQAAFDAFKAKFGGCFE